MATRKTAEAESLETTAAVPEDPKKTIEDWAKEKKTDISVLAGVKAKQHWNNGKSVTEQEFVSAVDGFLNGSTRRGRR